jgi:hypothetical protein
MPAKRALPNARIAYDHDHFFVARAAMTVQ